MESTDLDKMQFCFKIMKTINLNKQKLIPRKSKRGAIAKSSRRDLQKFEVLADAIMVTSVDNNVLDDVIT